MPLFEDKVLHRFKILETVPDSILPDYNGLGLSSLVPSVSQWLGGPELYGQVFDDVIMSEFAPRYRRVVVLLVDALGYNWLIRMITEGKVPFWQKQLEKGLLFPISSVCPSTTATALTTLWSGADPNQHGVIGYEMYLSKYGMNINNLFHTPAVFENDIGGLSRAGFDPETFIGFDPVGVHFAKSGIESHAIMPAHIIGSGLSRMHMTDVFTHGFYSDADMWIKLRRLLNTPKPRKQYIYLYWSLVDSLMHRNGRDHESGLETFIDFSYSLERVLLGGMNDFAKKDTLVLLTADHGSVDTPIDDQYDLNNHPELRDMLILPPTCEGRLPFFYIKASQDLAVKQYIEQTWPDKFVFLRRDDVLEMGLFGLGQSHSDLHNRIGDYVLIPKEPEVYFWWPAKRNVLVGRHGGLHKDEMLVPLFALSL